MSDQSEDFVKSLCSLLKSLSLIALIVDYTFVSSTKIFTKFAIESGKSLINTKKRAGPRSLPCGIPESI